MAGKIHEDTQVSSNATISFVIKKSPIKLILTICTILFSISTTNAIANTSQCLSIKSKLCNSYKELNQIRKQQSFIEMGFSPGGPHKKWLEQVNIDSGKYDRMLSMDCSTKELKCTKLAGELCMTFSYLHSVAVGSVRYRDTHTMSGEAATQMNKDFKKFCK